MGKEIDLIREEMEDDGVIEPNTKKSWDWLTKNIEEITENNQRTLIQELKRTSDFRIVPRVGKFYMFSYLAKHRATMPYYDRFPMLLVLRVNNKEEYMLGLNMHYLPIKFRARFMKSILMFLNNKKWDDSTRFKVTWELLNALSTSPILAPAIKRYNYEQLRSRFIIVEEDEWDIVTMLPTEMFTKASTKEVWTDSVLMINAGQRKKRPSAKVKPRKTPVKSIKKTAKKPAKPKKR